MAQDFHEHRSWAHACFIALGLLALSQLSVADETRVPEVIVTAERRPANAQTLPLSVSTLSQHDVQALSLRTTDDLGMAIPGLQFTRQGLGATPFIRGVGTTSGAVGNESPVAVYVDGVYFATPNAAIFPLQGASQIDVLKGPQGTLFGRNATGGIIQITTPDPEVEPSAEILAQYGNYATTQGWLYATGGQGPMALNVSLYARSQRNGWGRALAAGTSTFDQRDAGTQTKLLWQAAPDTRVQLAARYFDRHSTEGLGYHFLPGSLGLDGRSTFSGFYNTLADPADIGRYRSRVYSARVEHDFDRFRVVDLTAWQDMHGFFRLDQDMTPAPLIQAPISQYQRALTQELQALSLAEASIQWIVGLYYLRDLSAYEPLSLQGISALPFSALEIRSRQHTESYAAFGQLSRRLTEKTRLTLGARYTRDERTVHGTTEGIASGFATQLGFADQSTVWSRPTWRIAVDRTITPALMAYVSWDRGFKSGVYNLLSYAAPAVDPEVLDAWQTGIKSEWLQQRLRINAGAFSYRYQNIQIDRIVSGATLLMNAAAARMRGLDLDLEYVPWNAFALHTSVSLLSGHYTDFRNGPISSPVRDGSGDLIGGTSFISGDLAGFETVRSPKLTGSFDARLRAATRFGTFGFNAGYSYNSGFAWDPDNRIRQSPYSLVNASFTWISPGSGTLSARAAGSNLTSRKLCAFAAATAPGDLCAPRPPRLLSIELSMRL